MSPSVAVCLKWVDHRPAIDPLTGEVRTDPRTSGASGADRAALEYAIRLGGTWGWPVVAITAGGPQSEAVLREALAVGAQRAIRCDLPADRSSDVVGRTLAEGLSAAPAGPSAPDTGPEATEENQGVVICGAWSLDRGSGSVPAFLAARLGAAQALGLVSMEFAGDSPGTLRAERRLDGGRRERLEVAAPAVVSVEAGALRLRRASLDGVLQARNAHVERLTMTNRAAKEHPPSHTASYRPRPRVLASPGGTTARQRVLALTGATVDRPAARTVSVTPSEAADLILEQLRSWGYLA